MRTIVAVVLSALTLTYNYVLAERNAESEAVCRPFLTSPSSSPLDASLKRNFVYDEEGEFHCELVLQDRDLPAQIRVTVHEGLMQLAMRHVEMGIDRHATVLRHIRVLREIIPKHKGFAINHGIWALDPKSLHLGEAMDALQCALYGSCDAYPESVSLHEEYQAYMELARLLAYHGNYRAAADALSDAWRLSAREGVAPALNADCAVAAALDVYARSSMAIGSVKNASDITGACEALKTVVHSLSSLVNAGSSIIGVSGCELDGRCRQGSFGGITSSEGAVAYEYEGADEIATASFPVPRVVWHYKKHVEMLTMQTLRSVLSGARATIEKLSSAETAVLGINLESITEFAVVNEFLKTYYGESDSAGHVEWLTDSSIVSSSSSNTSRSEVVGGTGDNFPSDTADPERETALRLRDEGPSKGPRSVAEALQELVPLPKGVVPELDGADVESMRFKVGMLAGDRRAIIPMQTSDECSLMTVIDGELAVKLVPPGYAFLMDTIHPSVHVAPSGVSYQFIAESSPLLERDLKLRRVSRLGLGHKPIKDIPYISVNLTRGDLLFVPAGWFVESSLHGAAKSIDDASYRNGCMVVSWHWRHNNELVGQERELALSALGVVAAHVRQGRV